MTRFDYIINELNNDIWYDKEIEQIFNLIYKRDYEVFCSQMGDYDHPEERRESYKKFDEAMKSHSATLLEKITIQLTKPKYEELYDNHFHSMLEEVS